MTMRTRPSFVALIALWFCVLVGYANATVRLPNGEYTEMNEDLKVKVLGGFVTVARTWSNGRWYVNPSWADLQLTHDAIDGSVKAVDRAGAIYERTSSGVFVFAKRYFINATATGFRWHDQRGNWGTYDAAGRHTAYGDRNNVQVSFRLDGNGRRTQAVDHFGNVVLTFEYTGDKLTAIVDRVGRRVQYQYTGTNLTTVIDALGNPWHYGYDAFRQIASRTNPENHTIRISYVRPTTAFLAVGGTKAEPLSEARAVTTGAVLSDYRIARVGTMTDAEDQKTVYAYAYNRTQRLHTVTQTFPGGRKVVGIYDVEGRLRQQTIGSRVVYRMARDGDRIETITDERGLQTRTEYDGVRNPLRMTYADGTSVSATYDSVYSNPLTMVDEAGTRTSYQYDSRGNLLRVTEAAGLSEERATTVSYDQYGQPLTVTRKGATVAEDASVTYTYDTYGNIETATDPLGHKAEHTFDVMGNLLTMKDRRLNTWIRTYNLRGWLRTLADPLGHLVEYRYDKVGNLTHEIDPLKREMIFGYTKNDWLETINDALNGVTRYEHDLEGRTTRVTDQNKVPASFSYDRDGRLSKYTDGNGNDIQIIYGNDSDALNGLVSTIVYPTYAEGYKYDARNRVTQSLQVLDQATSYLTLRGYDGRGNVVSETDALGRATIRAYDALNRLSNTTDAMGGVTQFAYDKRDNLLAVADAKEQTTSYQYDLGDRMVRDSRPSGQATRYAYDDNDNLTKSTNPKGEERRFIYDLANRQTREEQYSVVGGVPGTSPVRTIDFSYDERDLLTGYNDGTTSASYSYDEKWQRRSDTVNYGAFTKKIQYEYQANGKKSSFTYPDDAKATYGYDGNNLPQKIVAPGGTINYTNFQWLAPKTITVPGATVSNAYDGLLRPAQIKVNGNGGGTPVLDYAYSYDALSNVVQRITQDGAYAYEYDNLERLTKATPPATVRASSTNPNGLPVEAYAYDSVHNRIASAHQPGPWTYNQDNQLLGYGQGPAQVALEYDPNGHTSKRTEQGTTQSYAYDAAERLTEVKVADAVAASYYYDPFGRRLQKTVGGSTTYFQYADEGLVAEYDATGNTLRSYGWTPDSIWGTDPQFLRVPSGTYFYHNDHLGTPQKLTDAAGNVSWSAKSEAFGTTTVGIENVANPLRFPGQYYDSEAATHYNYFRNYDSSIGRYFQADPFGLAGGINAYAYVVNDPLNLYDPFGLDWRDWAQGAIDFTRGAGDTLSFGLAKKAREYFWGGLACIQNQGAYLGGEVAGVAIGLAMGSAHAGRNVVAQMGRQGNLMTRVARGTGRLFYDNRTWGSTRSTWSEAMNGLKNKGLSLHHWLLPQRWSAIPQGIRNAGFNYMPLTAGFNSWMNGLTAVRTGVEWGFKGAVVGVELSPIHAAIRSADACGVCP